MGKRKETSARKYELRAEAYGAPFESARITGPSASAAYAMRFYGSDIDIYESCFIMLLDRSKTVIGWAKISQGGVSSTVIDTKIVCKYAVDTLASGVIVVHNHPSRNTVPSMEDRRMAKGLKAALALLDCALVDSIILTGDGSYMSFVDEGII